MERRPGSPLAFAGWIAAAMYLVALAVLPAIAAFAKIPHSYAGASLRLLAPILAVVAVGDYIASLFIERSMLRRSVQQGVASGPAVVVVRVATLGVSIALYGFVLSLLGSTRWPLFFYALCFIHGVHLAFRWPNYEAVARTNG